MAAAQRDSCRCCCVPQQQQQQLLLAKLELQMSLTWLPIFPMCLLHAFVCDEGGVCVSIDYRSCSLILRLTYTHTHTHTCVTLHMSNKKGVDFYAPLFLFCWEFFYTPRTCELLVLLIVSLIIFSRTLFAVAAAAAGCSVDKAQPQPRIVGGDNSGWGVRFYTHAHTHTRKQMYL